MIFALILSAAGLVIGAAMGLYAMLVSPAWASRLVRLTEDPSRPGGFSEFRATYGGLFAGTHLVALAFTAAALREPAALQVALPALAVVAAAWGGTAIGRAIAIVIDKAAGGFALGSLVFEAALAVAIAAPLILTAAA